MRIISGEYKGRRYSGAIPSEIRPTTDKVRESIFNILENYIDFDGIIVADVCAGTGFMGFEALSRGASFCYFFEKSRKASHIIKDFAESLILLVPEEIESAKKKNQIIFGDAQKKINSLSKDSPELKLNLIFFDPPYASMLFNPIIDAVTNSGLVQKGTIFVIEHSVKSKLLLPVQWELLTERNFGDTGVIFAKYK